jgi:hypothetical protein
MLMFLLRDWKFQKAAKKLAKRLEYDIENIDKWTHLTNPQVLHKKFKTKIKDLAIQRAKQAMLKMDKQIKLLEDKHQRAWNELDKSEPERMALAGAIQDQIGKLKQKQFRNTKMSIKAHFNHKGKSTTKFWSNLNKENKP